MGELYEVVFNGEIRSGARPDVVQEGLARLFGQPLDRIAVLFSGRQVTIKSGIDRTAALRYQADMARVGAISYVHSTGVADDVRFGGVNHEAAHAEVNQRNQDFSLSGVFASLMVCPRCGHQQLAGEFCANCRASFKELELEEKRRQKREKIMAQRRAEAADAPIDTAVDHSAEVEFGATGEERRVGNAAPRRTRIWWVAGAVMLLAGALAAGILGGVLPAPG